MPYPSQYTRGYSFTSYQTNEPDVPLPGDKVDVELNAIAIVTANIIAQMALIQRADGALANASVGFDQLKAELSIGINPAEPWATATAYVVGDSVVAEGGLYRCLIAHTSDDFSIDLSFDRWVFLAQVGTEEGGSVDDGDYGDVVVSDSGATWSFDSGVVSTFARTFLDDLDAAAVRTTLGVIGAASPAFTTAASLTLSDNGAGVGPILTLDRLSASPADNDYIGAVYFTGRDESGNTDSYAQIVAQIIDATNTTEDSRLVFGTTVGGASNVLYFGAGLYDGSLSDPGDGRANFTDYFDDGVNINTLYQAKDATLTALAGVTTAADKLIYATGSDTFSTTDFTSAARDLLDDADASAMRTTLGLVIGTNVQAYDGALQTLSALSLVSGDILYATGSETLTRLAKGTNGQVLKLVGGVPAWDTDLTGGSSLSDGTYGDIAVSGTGTIFTVGNNAVTYAKLQDISATKRILGRKTASSGDAEECTITEILDMAGSAAQGDILYRGASSWALLPAGTSGRFLQTLGAGANPAWADAGGSYTFSATDKLLGRVSSGGGAAEEVTCTDFAQSLLDDADAATARATLSAAGTGVANTFTADQQITSTDAGAGVGPILDLYRNSGSPAASDLIGEVLFSGKDSASNVQSYAAVYGEITDPTSTSEDANLVLASVVAGTLAARMKVGNGLFYAAGSDMGSGTGNFANLFVAGAAISTLYEAANADLSIVNISAQFDGGGSAIAVGKKVRVYIPFNCTINEGTMGADQTGSAVVDVWADTHANYPPTVADTITASAKLTISSATKSQDSTLTGWTKTIAAGTWLIFNVDSCSSIQELSVNLKATKT